MVVGRPCAIIRKDNSALELNFACIVAFITKVFEPWQSSRVMPWRRNRQAFRRRALSEYAHLQGRRFEQLAPRLRILSIKRMMLAPEKPSKGASNAAVVATAEAGWPLAQRVDARGKWRPERALSGSNGATPHPLHQRERTWG